MDGIVKQIYSAMETQPHLQSTLFVMCGDHGMNDAGNHGASSPGETSAALVFMSPKLSQVSSGIDAPILPADEYDYYTTVEQSDIAPTLAALLGFPAPKNNLGAMIPNFLPFWPASKDKVQILVRNAKQIIDIVTAAFGSELFESSSGIDPCAADTTEISELACEWRSIDEEAYSQSKSSAVDGRWLAAASLWIRQAQELMSSMASNYDMGKLFLGQGMAISAVLFCITASIVENTREKVSAIPLIILSASHGGMMFASSYVEEEHHFWYWSATIWMAYLGARRISR